MMNDFFLTILNGHESDDDRQAAIESLLLAAMRREFSNSKEIFEAAKDMSLTVRDLMAGRITDFPILPIRQSDAFYCKKHTKSQIPYFHGHLFYELLFVHRGKCFQQFEDGSRLCLTKGQCFLLCPNAVHKIERSDSSDVVLKLVIPCELFKQTGEGVLGDLLLKGRILFDKVSETAEYAILKLLREQSRKDRYKDGLIRSYLTILFTELATTQPSDYAIEALLNDYFEKNGKNATLSEFAKAQSYHVNYLSRLIKKRTGKSFSELLRLYRMHRAKRLLTESDLSIEAIAFEVGYASASGFYRQFFSSLGMTPAEYRNRLK